MRSTTPDPLRNGDIVHIVDNGRSGLATVQSVQGADVTVSLLDGEGTQRVVKIWRCPRHRMEAA